MNARHFRSIRPWLLLAAALAVASAAQASLLRPLPDDPLARADAPLPHLWDAAPTAATPASVTALATTSARKTPDELAPPGMLVRCSWVCYPGAGCEYVCRNFPY